MSPSVQNEDLEKFRGGVAVLAEALDGVSSEASSRIPAPGKWTINQIARHLADTEIVVGMRLRQIIAEDRPTLSPFNQELWAEHLGYEKTNPSASLAIFGALRNDTATLIESLPAEIFDRVSVHPERGEKSLLEWVRLFTAHVSSHAEQIRRIRTPSTACTSD